jgi:LysM repeat protein
MKILNFNLNNFNKFFIWVLVLLVTTNITFAGETEKTKRDTVSAMVMYGETTLLDDLADASLKEIIDYRDSILSAENFSFELINKLNLLISIHDMNKFEVASLIDSLFEMEVIPYAMINQINLYLDKHPPKEVTINELPKEFIVNLCQSQFPADTFYQGWNTDIPNPYNHDLSAKDTVINLILEGVLPNDEFKFPLDKKVMTSSFGWREGRMHSGVDLDLEVWDPVKVVFPGVVRVARYFGGYGRVVVVRHYNGLETLYAHLHRFKVVPGQKVEAGDVVGLGGSSGRSSGSHLHFETRFKGIAINPAHFIDFDKEKVVHQKVKLVKTKDGFAALPEGVNLHTVERGDNLYEIANRYGTTINKLCALNGIQRNSILYVGQKIRVI